MQVRPGCLDDYLQAHQVWPELREVIHACGIHNYALFARPDGLIVGYLEGDDIAESLRRIARTDVSLRWEIMMAEYLLPMPGDENGVEEWLVQYFYNP